MTDYRGVAAMTATLQNLLQDAIQMIPGAAVRASRPDRETGTMTPAGLVNLFLYQVQPNANWRNQELPVRRADGSLIRRPQLAVDLHYLLSFYGDDAKSIPQLLLGLASTALHSFPYPDPSFIPRPDPRAEDEALDLGRSGLVDQIQVVQLVPLAMNHDELSKLWSIFFQVPYALSLAYRCSVLLLEPDLTPQPPALPVRRPIVLPVQVELPPQLDQVTPQVVPYRPGTLLTLTGRHLRGAGWPVARFGEIEAVAVPVDAGSVRVPLPEGVRAGVVTVRLARSPGLSSPARKAANESNPVAFVLQPWIPARPEVVELPPDGSVPAGPALRLEVAPAVYPGQTVRLFLHEIEVAPEGGREPRSLSFAVPDRGEPSGSLEVPTPGVAAGTYLVRLQVDGVTSHLEIDRDPASPTYGRYSGPRAVYPGATA